METMQQEAKYADVIREPEPLPEVGRHDPIPLSWTYLDRYKVGKDGERILYCTYASVDGHNGSQLRIIIKDGLPTIL